jgi:hypothetical protein
MARTDGPFGRSIAGCLAFLVLGGLIVYAGASASIIFGALSLLGGFTQIGDRRRDGFSGFGMMAFGAILLLIGIAMQQADK